MPSLSRGESFSQAAARFPGQYEVIGEGVDPVLFEPDAKRNLIVLEWRPNERALVRGAFRVRGAD